MADSEKPGKEHFCQGYKCSLITAAVIAVSIAIIVVVTLFSHAVRSPEQPGAGPQTDGPTDKLPWWKTTIVYQIYPRSFQDSDGDGIGDLKGVTSRLDYFTELHVDAIWLSPFYSSPMKDFGYDVSNYTEIDSIFGTMADFDQMMTTAHAKDIKVIVDFVPNHASIEIEWFQKARLNDTYYKDFFIWSPGKLLLNGTRVPPNNWKSVFEGPAWKWDDSARQYYYHAFLESQVDFDFRNPEVLKTFDGVLRFWLDKGVDGFRIDAVPHMFEDADLSKDEPPGESNGFNPNIHKYTKNQPEIFSVISRWRHLLDEYEARDGKIRFLVSETVGIPASARHQYYKAGSVPFYFRMIGAGELCNATVQCYLEVIRNGTLAFKSNEWPNFVIGNHDNRRIADRMGGAYVDAMNMLLLMLPGTPTTYYGEELGMRGGNYTGQEPKDPYAITSHNWENSRDSERNPMQWNTSRNAGFTSGTTPWLNVTENTRYRTFNVEVESRSNTSSFAIYKALAMLRKRSAFQNTFIELPNSAKNVISFIRGDNHDKYWVGVNIGTHPESIQVVTGYSRGTVVVATQTLVDMVGTQSDLAHEVSLQPGEGIVMHLES